MNPDTNIMNFNLKETAIPNFLFQTQTVYTQEDIKSYQYLSEEEGFKIATY